MKKIGPSFSLVVACAFLLLTSGKTLGAVSPRMTCLAPETFADLAEQTAAAVVNISSEREVEAGFFHGFLGGFPQTLKVHSLGSGIIMDPQGYVITNNHVVKDAQKIRVILVGGREFKGTVKGRDPKTDLALVHIVNPPSNLPFLKLGDSDAIRPGDWVLAVGNPFGLSHTVTQGIISAKGRIIGDGPYDRFLQTDASINPGNSGGPLLNLAGEVIGINSAVLATGQGIGFAIPSNMAKFVIPQLKEKGKVIRGMIGVQVQTVTPQLAKKLGLSKTEGALVMEVHPGSPAAKAGIKSGDVIADFAGHPIHRMRDLPSLTAETPPGTEVTVTVVRSGKEMKFKLKVAELPAKDQSQAG